MMDVHPLLSADLRANPAYELICLDRLRAEEAGALAGLDPQGDLYGVLRPRDQAPLSLKGVNEDTALLFFTLRDPGPLPSFARRRLGMDATRVASALVLDGVLEAHLGGAFVSGAAASARLGELGLCADGDGAVESLSTEALRLAIATGLTDTFSLGARLYRHNTAPLTPRWRRRLPDLVAVKAFLGLNSGAAAARAVAEGWQATSSKPPWLAWQRRRASAAPSPLKITWKLYVSPPCEALPEALAETLSALRPSQALQVKVGADAPGLLRPDKLVAYFPTFEALAQGSEAIGAALGGCPAQGLPFTGEILAGSRLLSWGVDPPPDRWRGRESWRGWVTHRLADALVAAQLEGRPSSERLRFALQRVQLEGVDTRTWAPGKTMFRDDGSQP